MRASERLAEELLNSLDQELLVSSLRDSAFEFGEEMKVELRSNVLGEDGGELGRTNDVWSTRHRRTPLFDNPRHARLHHKGFRRSNTRTTSLRLDRTGRTDE